MAMSTWVWAFGQSLGPGGVDAQGVDPAGGLGRLAVPAVGLVAAPGGGDGGEGEEHGGDDLDPVPPCRRVGARRRGGGHAGLPASSQGIVRSPPMTVELLIDEQLGAFHRHWLETADVAAVRLVEEGEEQQHGGDDGDHAAHEHPLDPDPFAAVGEPEDVGEHDGRDEEQGDPQRGRHQPGGPVDASLAGRFPVGGLVQPLAVGRLLLGRTQLDVLQRLEHGGAPRVDVLAERAVLHAVPLVVDDPPRIADQLAGEGGADVGREGLGGLDLLGHGQRFDLGSGA